jgi:hypothetical protein
METLLEFASYAHGHRLRGRALPAAGGAAGFAGGSLRARHGAATAGAALPGREISFGLLAGLVVPTCECGVVPIARKLLVRGVPPRVVIPTCSPRR